MLTFGDNRFIEHLARGVAERFWESTRFRMSLKFGIITREELESFLGMRCDFPAMVIICVKVRLALL